MSLQQISFHNANKSISTQEEIQANMCKEPDVKYYIKL